MAITTNGAAGAGTITQLPVGSSADFASIVSDESGTGVMVFNTLPTFGTTGVKLSGSTSGTTTVVSGATAGASVLTLPVATDTLVGKATTDTLTNKSISFTTNSHTGTLAEFNSALSGDNFVSLTGSETLTNKTLTSPVISTITNGAATLTVPTSTGTLALSSSVDATISTVGGLEIAVIMSAF